MNKSDKINELAAALSKAQGEIAGVVKDASNPFFKSQYATLLACTEAIKKPFADNGLSVTQLMDESEPGYVTVVTVLMHSSGQWISGRISGKPVKDDPQGMGSAITYYRRYSLMAMVGLAPEDDDGNVASGKGGGNEVQSKNRVPDKAQGQASKVGSTVAAPEKVAPRDGAGSLVQGQPSLKPKQTASAIYCPANDNKIQAKTACAECAGKKECFVN